MEAGTDYHFSWLFLHLICFCSFLLFHSEERMFRVGQWSFLLFSKSCFEKALEDLVYSAAYGLLLVFNYHELTAHFVQCHSPKVEPLVNIGCQYVFSSRETRLYRSCLWRDAGERNEMQRMIEGWMMQRSRILLFILQSLTLKQRLIGFCQHDNVGQFYISLTLPDVCCCFIFSIWEHNWLILS